tara:strand:+ start:4222 stop:4659 length:438 start_codon:yes stop_codon:yes gene_type:complete
MTTIAYHHDSKTIAFDSRMTMRGVVSSDNHNKIIRKDNTKFVLCGSTCDFDEFMELQKGEKYKGELELDASGIKIVEQTLHRDVYYVFMHDNVMCEDKLSCNLTLGSGAQFATSAMDFGKSAKEAVEYAITRDIYSGGEVREVEL